MWTAAILYFSLWPVVGYDVPNWLLPWYSRILETGRWAAFSEPFGNYTPPYLYLLALFSNLSPWLSPIAVLKIMAALQSLLLAGAVWYLLRTLGAPQAPAGSATILVLPPVVINGPVLAQCDPLWVAPCVVAVANAIRARTWRMLAWFGLAVAIKFQAMFLAPFVLAMVLRWKAPLLPSAAMPILVYAFMMLPAAAAGWPPWDLATIYVRQAAWAHNFISNAANPWTFGNLNPELAKQLFPLGYAAALCVSGLIAFWSVKSRPNRSEICQFALIFAILVPFLLPRMHERYFLLADIISFCLAWADRRFAPVALLVIASSTSALIGYLVRAPAFTMSGAVMMAAAAMLAIRSLKTEGPMVSRLRGNSPEPQGLSSES